MADQRWWTKKLSGWNVILAATWPLPDWRSLMIIIGKNTKPIASLMFPCLTRGWAGGGASLRLRYHSWRFPSVVGSWWRPVWQICDQNKRQQKISSSSRAQRPRRWAYQGCNWPHGWYWVWNRALWCHIGPTLSTHYRGCSHRYMDNIAKCEVSY